MSKLPEGKAVKPEGVKKTAAKKRRSTPATELVTADIVVESEAELCPYDENLLERARAQWQFGDWESLTRISRDTLQHHPDRAELALLAAAGHLQMGDTNTARQFIRLARDWGGNEKLISQTLIAGVHNSLARAAAASGQGQRALKHFESAIVTGTPGGDVRLLLQARIGEQFSQMGLPAPVDMHQALADASTATLLPSLDQDGQAITDQLKKQNADLVTQIKCRDDEINLLHKKLENSLSEADALLENAVRQTPGNVDLLIVHAEMAMCREIYQEAVRRWQDIAGILSQETPQTIYDRLSVAYAKIVGSFGGTPEENACRGDRHKHEILAFIHKELNPDFYLEIGVDEGLSLSLAKRRAIGVDPRPQLRLRKALSDNATIIQASSDEFFNNMAAVSLNTPPDLVFIDGMHFFEFALRDFMNVERYSSSTTLIVIDDIYPCNRAQAERRRRTNAWTGDVWKLHEILRTYRPDLPLMSLNSYHTGLLLISGLDAENRVLWDHYDDIVNHYSAIAAPPTSVIARAGAVPCDDETLVPFLDVINQAKRNGEAHQAFIDGLRDVINRAQSSSSGGSHDQTSQP